MSTLTLPDEMTRQLPEPIYKQLLKQWDQISETRKAIEVHIDGQKADQIAHELMNTLVASEFVASQLQRFGANVLPLFEHDAFGQRWDKDLYQSQLEGVIQECQSKSGEETGLWQGLRLFRNRAMVRLIWRDANQLTEMSELTQELTWLAEVSVQTSLDFYHRQLALEWGEPLTKGGKQQQLIVLGMGKLGANELNLSSDIDLIFAFGEEGTTDGKEKNLSNSEFFIRVGQKLIKSLSQITVEGFVFRVDMRLRPNGQSGPLAVNINAMETYYEKQGRDWERYAMIKARVIAGDQEAGAELMDALRPFVYRRYVDFGAFESLRDMKELINREVKRKGVTHNIKTGAGGIREVEFIAQAFQLIRGGPEPVLQERSLLKILKLLPQLGLLPQAVCEELKESYVFLRNVEHRIQAMEDRQTQLLPNDELTQARLAYGLGFDDWPQLLKAIDGRRERIHKHFQQVANRPEDEEGGLQDLISDDWDLLWCQKLDSERCALLLSDASLSKDEQAELLNTIDSFLQKKVVKQLKPIARDRLDAVMPRLFCEVVHCDGGMAALPEVLEIIEVVLRRSSYLALLGENPKAVKHMVRLCSASPWISDQIKLHPSLMYELINADTLYSPPQLHTLKDEIRQQLLRIPEDDLEWQMETLRHFKSVHWLRTAAAEVVGSLRLMKVSDYLTYISEVCLDAVLQLAWLQMVERYGRPTREGGESCELDFAIIAYGKLGGIELSYGSDLDLVFIHDADAMGSTDGEKPIDNSVFFTRLGQRIIHLLTAQTPSGRLYEVDMRLRPSGASGLLVTSLKAFEKYQRTQAWTWEHQALVRARFIAGCEGVRKGFESIRKEILSAQREPQKLRSDVLEMREKMRAHLGASKKDMFHLKHGPGGIVDIEFLVQYLVLKNSCEHPELCLYTDNIRILEAAEEAGILTPEQRHGLSQSYLTYRSETHNLALLKKASQVSEERFEAERSGVIDIWNQVFSE